MARWVAAPAHHTPALEFRYCRCSLPGLTGFTTFRREGTNRDHHKTFPGGSALAEISGTGIVTDEGLSCKTTINRI
jgi:hypothetical protein